MHYCSRYHLSMQAWVLGCPNLQLPHSPPASIWYSRTMLTDTPPLAKLYKTMEKNYLSCPFYLILISVCQIIYVLNHEKNHLKTYWMHPQLPIAYMHNHWTTSPRIKKKAGLRTCFAISQPKQDTKVGVAYTNEILVAKLNCSLSTKLCIKQFQL